jgi:hypothetical protein
MNREGVRGGREGVRGGVKVMPAYTMRTQTQYKQK